MSHFRTCGAILAIPFLAACSAFCQTAAPAPAPAATPAATATDAQAPAPPAALSTPAFAGPLQQLPPAEFDAGPLRKIAVNGVITGFGMWQDNHVPGDNTVQSSLSNGQIFIQKPDGWFQVYVQAGAYTLPALATPFLDTGKTVNDFYGPVPQGFVKLAPTGKWKNT